MSNKGNYTKTKKRTISDIKNSNIEPVEQVLSMNRVLLDTIFKACKENADNFHVDYVPISFLKMIHDIAFTKLETSMRAAWKAGQ